MWYSREMACRASMFWVMVWEWMPCLPPTMANSPLWGVTLRGIQPITGLRPASPTLSVLNSNLPDAVLNVGTPYSKCGSGSSTTPSFFIWSSDTPTVASCASAQSSAVNWKYSPTPHASARPLKISSHVLVSGWIFSKATVRMPT